MKKLIFLIHFGSIKNSSGIIEKVITQSQNMKKENMLHKTYILYKKEDIEDTKIYDKYDFIEFVPLEFYRNKGNLIQKLIMIEKIYLTYEKICIKEAKNYDYIYVRYNPLFLGFIKFVRRFKNKFIFEHNSIEIDEYKANKSKINVIRTILLDNFVRKCAVLYVAVSTQIFEYQKKKYKNRIKGILIPNGVDAKKYNVRQAPTYDGKTLNLIFVGNIRYWHGIERIIYAIDNYKGLVKINLEIYGPINQNDYLSEIINNVKVKDQIKFLGYRSNNELDSAFNHAHAAIGSLGTYKKKIEYASTLKNREYASRGIPIIASDYDDDLTKAFEGKYYYKVKNDESSIDMQDIIKFVENLYKNDISIATKEIRNFAEEVLDYSKKVLVLKEAIHEIESTKD